jgi:hypothetical protein
MSVLDFLFEGKPPASVTTYGQSVQNVPTWLSDYTQGLIARANTVSAEPYQSYEGPRVAGFSPLQQAAQTAAGDNVGKWGGLTDAAAGQYSSVANSPGALSQASQYLQGAGGSYIDNVQKYMNPYTENVIDRSTELANRNLTQKLLPSINSNFIKSGAFGSAAQQRAVGNALRDTTGEVQSQARAALADSYNTGASIYGQDASRQLQAGQTTGTLAGQDLDRQLATGQSMGALAQLTSQLRGQDTAGLAAAGADQQAQTQRNLDTAYGDFQAQRDYPKEQVNWMSQIINGLPNQGGTTNTSSTGPAENYQPSLASQLASLYSIYQGVKGKSRGGLAQYSRGGRSMVPVRRRNYAQGGLATMRRISNGR